MVPASERAMTSANQEEQGESGWGDRFPLADRLLQIHREEMSTAKREQLQIWLARRGLSLESLEEREEHEPLSERRARAPPGKPEWGQDPTSHTQEVAASSRVGAEDRGA